MTAGSPATVGPLIMKSTKNLHYVPQAYQRRFANDKDQIAYAHPKAGVTITKVRNTFSRNTKGIPLFNESEVTHREQTAMRLVAFLDEADDEELRIALRQLALRDNSLKLPLTTDFLGCLCDYAVLQMTREPEWKETYLQTLAEREMTHQEYYDAMAKLGYDPYTLAGDALTAQHGLSVVISTQDEFLFGSQFITPMSNGDFVAPVGRKRALLLTADKRFAVKKAYANKVARYNRQILMRARSCGTHPNNRYTLDQLQHKLGSKWQPLARVQIPTDLLKRGKL